MIEVRNDDSSSSESKEIFVSDSEDVTDNFLAVSRFPRNAIQIMKFPI